MMNEFKNKWKKVFSLILCTLIAVNSNALSVYATEDDVNENSDNPIIVVSMGDSYSSGEGIEPFYGQDEGIENKVKNPDWLAHRSTKSWSSRLKVDGLDGTLSDYKDENWFFVAASGAVTDNLKKKFDKDYDRDGCTGTYSLDPQLDVFDNFEKNTVDYVTLTFGGNDVGFSDIITTAVTDNLKEVGINGFIGIARATVINGAFSVPYVNVNSLTDRFNQTWEDFYADGGTEYDIQKAYSDIAEAAGENARIIVAGYPKLVEQNGKGLPFTKEQAEEINRNVTLFNEALRAIVTKCHDEKGMKIYFASVEEEFNGHEAYADTPYINEIKFTQKQDLIKFAMPPVSAYSIHPNDDGAAAYARCVQKTIDEIEAGLEEDTEEPTDDGSEKSDIQKKIDEEIERQQERALEWLEKKLEEWLNRWLMENCSC